RSIGGGSPGLCSAQWAGQGQAQGKPKPALWGPALSTAPQAEPPVESGALSSHAPADVADRVSRSTCPVTTPAWVRHTGHAFGAFHCQGAHRSLSRPKIRFD